MLLTSSWRIHRFQRNRLRCSGVGIIHSLRLPNHRYRLRATNRYTRFLRGLGMIRRRIAAFHNPSSLPAMRRTADDCVYTRPFSMSTIESTFGVCHCSARRCCAASDCKEAKRKYPNRSLRMMNCTERLHKLHTPSKRTTA